jgi:hypothetical protein
MLVIALCVLVSSCSLAAAQTWFEGPCSSDEIVKRREGFNPSVHM